MNKKELVSAISAESGLSKAKTKIVLQAVLAAITESLGRGERVTLMGFGSFRVVSTASRPGRNPRTGEAAEVPAGKKVSLKVGKPLAKAIKDD